MVRQYLAVLCAMLLVFPPLSRASTAAQPSNALEASIKQQIAEIAAGSVIEVKLLNKQKLRGRVGAITDRAFELQHARNNQIVTDQIAFDDVRSIKPIGQGMSTGKKVVIGTLIGAGVLFIIGLIACFAGGCNS